MLALGCSSSSSDASTVFRRRRFAGGAINATEASVLLDSHAILAHTMQSQTGIRSAAPIEGLIRYQRERVWSDRYEEMGILGRLASEYLGSLRTVYTPISIQSALYVQL